MSGFFALRRSAFQSAQSKLDPIGYKIGLELLVKCGFRNVAEVPIRFTNRCKGESKLNWKEQLNYLRHVKRLLDFRFGGWSQLVQFLAIGLTGVVVDAGAFALLLGLAPVAAARALAIWVAMTWNFVLNRKITFASAKGNVWQQYLGFCGACLLGAVVNWGVSLTLLGTLPFFAQYMPLAAVVGAIAGAASNFVLCRLLVFRSPQASPAIAEETAQQEANATQNRAA